MHHQSDMVPDRMAQSNYMAQGICDLSKPRIVRMHHKKYDSSISIRMYDYVDIQVKSLDAADTGQFYASVNHCIVS